MRVCVFFCPVGQCSCLVSPFVFRTCACPSDHRKFGAHETPRNKKGVTPLKIVRTLKRNANAVKYMWQALENRDILWVANLVGQGGTVDLRNDKGLTPLMMAVQRRDMRMVKCLLEQQADPNLREPED